MFGLHELFGRRKNAESTWVRLVPIDSWDGARKPLLVTPPAVVGRSSTADAQLHDPWISRIHCEFLMRDGMLFVRDLESRHGVYVNDKKVTQAALRAGDTLMLGVSRFRVDFDQLEAQPLLVMKENSAPRSN